MPDSTVRLNILSSFQTEGGEEAEQATKGIREELEGVAQAAEEAGESLTSRFTAAIEETAQATERTSQRLLEFKGYQGDLYTDIAQEAIQAGDRPTAAQALYRAAQEDEPESHIDRANRALAEARREAGEGAPGRGEDFDSFGREDRLSRNLQGRIEDAIPTIVANTGSGRLGVAERSLTNAEEYLEQLREMGHNTEALRGLTDTLAQHRDTLEEAKAERDAARLDPMATDGGGPDVQGMMGEVGDMATQRGLAGLGPAGGVIGRLARFLGSPGGLALMGAGATVGGGIALTRWLHNMGDEGREEAAGFLDLGRTLMTDDPLMYRFTSGGFASRPELRDLRYTAQDAGQFAAAYGMPTGIGAGSQSIPFPEDVRVRMQQGFEEIQAPSDPFTEDVMAGMRLARYTGTDTDAIAGLMRTGRQAGTFEAGGGETFATTIFRAVQDGTRLGVDAATTFQAMERHLNQMVQQGLTANQAQLAMQSVLMENFALTGSRALMGEAGAQAIEGAIGGLTQPGEPGMEMLALRSLSGPDGRMPSAEEMGLTGGLASQYEELQKTSEVMAGRFLMEQARGRNPEALSAIAGGFGDVLEGRTDLEYLFATQMLGLSYEQTAELRDTYGSVFGAFTTPMDQMSRDDIATIYGENIRNVPYRDDDGLRYEDTALGMYDPQDDDTNLTRAGLRQQRLEFLEEETGRMRSLVTATAEWTDTLTEVENRLIGGAARLRAEALEDSPEWWLERIENEDWDALEERIRERVRERAERERDELEGLPPDALENDEAAVGILMAAIADQETGATENPYEAVNPDSGAIGRYQIMPTNIEGEERGWDWQYLGRDIEPEDLRDRPAWQETIALQEMSRLYGLLSEDLTEDERLGRVAASWYAGPDFLDVPTDELSDHPQFSGDNEYPSIMQYVDEVLERIRGDATPAGDSTDEDSGPLDEGPMLDEGQMLDYYEQTAEDLDAEERLGRVAAAWHGGEEFLNVPTDELSEHPQFSGDNDYPSRRQYVEETMERILDDLQGNGSEREREPGQREPGTPDEGSLRIEGEGTIKVVVARDVPEATFLEDALGKGIRQWQDRLGSSRYNQHNRRG